MKHCINENHRKLLDGVNKLLSSSCCDLRDITYVRTLIEQTGIYDDGRLRYGHDNAFINAGEGLWQIPLQFAQTLVYLSKFRINSAIEIGTFAGWTTAFLTAYLQRFNPALRVLTIDPGTYFTSFEWIRDILPITYLHATAAEMPGNVFDLCLVDGDHSYAAVTQDYRHLGQHAAVCMFHDINDKYVWDGVPQFWSRLKQEEGERAEFVEFTYNANNDQVMGMGIRARCRPYPSSP